MRNFIFLFVLVCVFFVSISGAKMVCAESIYTVSGGISVGSVDAFIDRTNLGNSGEQTELDWVKKVLGDIDIIFEDKLATKEDDWIVTEENNDVFALKLANFSEYFMIKTGNTGDYDHFLFSNLESFDWAVVNLKESFGENYTIKNIGKFSHVSEYGTVAAPEPSAILLLGFGLLGLGFVVRRRK